MHFSTSYLLALSFSITNVHATSWYFLAYLTPSGESFTGFSGTMVVPNLPRAATYYLWPGLQPTDNSGVYQNVLDGNSGTWWLGSGWCCSNPSLPWGGGENAGEGDRVDFQNVLGGTWISATKNEASGASASDTFDLASKTFNQALFAIELDGPEWDFGPLAFENVVITSTGTDTSWCITTPFNYNNAAVYNITGVSSTVADNGVTCMIQSLVLESPA